MSLAEVKRGSGIKRSSQGEVRRASNGNVRRSGAETPPRFVLPSRGFDEIEMRQMLENNQRGSSSTIGRRRRSGYDDSIPTEVFERVLRKLRVRAYKGRMFRDLFLYVLFFAIFLTIVFVGRDLRKLYFVESSLKDIFVGEEFLPTDAHIEKNFHDIGEVEEFWMWMRGPFINALSSVNKQEKGYILSYNRIIGRPRMRQVRVKNSCAIPNELDPFFSACYPNFDSRSKDTAPFGPGLKDVDATEILHSNSSDASKTIRTTAEGNRIYMYHDWDAPTTFGWISNYDGDGYVAEFSYNGQVSREIVEFLEKDEWVDVQTRCVIISVNVYNANVNTFVSMLFIVEMHAGGGFVTSTNFRSFKADMYLSAEDKFRLFLEVLFLLGLFGWISYTIRNLYLLKKNGGSVFLWFMRPWWNFLDVLNKVMLLGAVCFYVYHAVSLNSWRESIQDLDQTTDFSRMEELGWSAEVLYNIIAANLFVGMMVNFKYLSVNVRMSLLWRTLEKAAGDLLAFTIFFFIMFTGFVLTGHLLFGPALYNFHSFGRSFFTCFQMLLGEFSYEDMEERGNRVLAPVFFGLYMLLAFFVLLNMFIAIVTDAYSIVHEKAQSTVTIGTALRKTIHRNIAAMKSRWKRYFSRENIANTLQGNFLSSKETAQYIDTLLRRMHSSKNEGPIPEELSCDDLERYLDAPREDLERLYKRVLEYAAAFDAQDKDDEQFEEEDQEDAILDGVGTDEQQQADQERLHPLRAKRVGMRNLRDTINRLDEKLLTVETKTHWIIKADQTVDDNDRV